MIYSIAYRNDMNSNRIVKQVLSEKINIGSDLVSATENLYKATELVKKLSDIQSNLAKKAESAKDQSEISNLKLQGDKIKDQLKTAQKAVSMAEDMLGRVLKSSSSEMIELDESAVMITSGSNGWYVLGCLDSMQRLIGCFAALINDSDDFDQWTVSTCDDINVKLKSLVAYVATLNAKGQNVPDTTQIFDITQLEM